MQAEQASSDMRRVSIVICTDGRAMALENTLRCLQYLDGPPFEVCVVCGPTEDGTAEVVSRWNGRIKVGRNPERNLSISRNIGIAMADGEIVAFIDDDGLPEPEWLQQILRAFDDPKVAGAGGIVMDHTGGRPQYLYASADRLGNADWQRDAPANSYNFPFSFNFPYVQGTNSAFLREALLSIGGFDEEFEFYLDETDVCCRLIDAGRQIRQLPDAVIHHKFLPSAIRTTDRITRVLYPVLKNKLYFSLVNNHGHYPLRRAITDMTTFVQMQEADIRHHIEAGHLPPSDLDAFRRDVDRAWTVGLERGLSKQRRLLSTTLLDSHATFLEFPRPRPQGGREVFVFVSQEYPPNRMGGIGRYIHQAARAIAGLGHHVHVLTGGDEYDRVDFEDGVWVHRIVPRPTPPKPAIVIPSRIWAHASTMLSALRGVAARHSVNAVYAPIWDCEGIAILLDHKFPLVLGLQTTLRFWLESHPRVASDEATLLNFAEPMLAIEKRLLRECDGIHAISGAIARDISRAYDVDLGTARTTVVPLGLEDWSRSPVTAPGRLAEGALRILFVGRLEPRKGIDVLLKVLPRLLAQYPRIHVDIVGNDRIPGPSGVPYRASFQATASAELLEQIRFRGEVTESELRGFYRACDIFVAPSRFESFGLVLVEAMMFGKPIVTCRTGGVVEVVEEGNTALLAEPGDESSLEASLERLIIDPSLRLALGKAGRQRYETYFAPGPMAEGIIGLMRRASSDTRVREKAEAQ